MAYYAQRSGATGNKIPWRTENTKKGANDRVRLETNARNYGNQGTLESIARSEDKYWEVPVISSKNIAAVVAAVAAQQSQQWRSIFTMPPSLVYAEFKSVLYCF
ncbi:uncharacterized protein HD556DRAFT_1540297 [Suillus plorans]|uniref:Uncharacterized protein n=1 Tax=Suillus plorans TaxID=116603 RepID=A0A9P7DAQ1_9AGAM|nr:uncharacterized protein HD556DRAFT_1540297 [Suillus plorans]KAG1784876.1 hypothetical protein HD556DRAFT_1540297 [Suillus plorans]